MSKHVQVESNMSVTGANADVRIPMKIAMQKLFLAHLYKKVASLDINLPVLDTVHKLKLDGFPSRVFQHEYDHLEGIDFTQR